MKLDRLKIGRAAKMQRDGYTWDRIAEAFHCSPALIRQAIAQAARRRKIQQLVRNERNQIRELWKLGETAEDIAGAFCMSLASVVDVIGNLKQRPKNDHRINDDGMGAAAGTGQDANRGGMAEKLAGLPVERGQA